MSFFMHIVPRYIALSYGVSITYCTIRWLRVACNNALRIVIGYRTSDSASQMFVTHGIDTFEARR